MAAILPGDCQAGIVAISLGGLREVTASIDGQGDRYVIQVSFLPVTSFDPARNLELNRSKARSYALEALARTAGGGKSADVVGLQVISETVRGPRFVATLMVPQGGVAVTGRQPQARPPPIAAGILMEDGAADPAGILLSRRQDYLDTADTLCSMGLATARAPAPTADGFYQTVAQVEEDALRMLAVLTAEVEHDVLLLSVERDQLREAFAAKQKRFMEALTHVVSEYDKISDRATGRAP
jgi:hypothetical protein